MVGWYFLLFLVKSGINQQLSQLNVFCIKTFLMGDLDCIFVQNGENGVK